MKSTIILAAASFAVLAAPTAAFADDHDKISHRELRDDRANVAKQQQDLREAQMNGSNHDVRKQREDVRDARQELRQDRRDAYRAGVYARPAGYRDRAWANGDRLPSSYYARTYWVEPTRYKLAPVYNGDRWVRVNRDVVRVAPNGRVREVRRNWFY